MQVVMTVLTGLMALVACGDKDDRCRVAVRHILDPTAGGVMSKPGKEEQAIIDVVVKRTLAACHKEGLSQAQFDCILSAKSMDARLRLIECPAIAAHKPTWLLIPNAEWLKELDGLKRLAPSTELDPEVEKALSQELEGAAQKPAP